VSSDTVRPDGNRSPTFDRSPKGILILDAGGQYAVELNTDHSLTFHIEAGSFPNWSGTEQKRPFTVSGDELKCKTAAASGGGSAELVWKRAR
jgi:hypothetical protein